MSAESESGRWIAVVGPPGSGRDAVLDALKGRAEPRLHDQVKDLLEAEHAEASEVGPNGGEGKVGRPSGLVVLTRDVPAEDALRAVERAGEGGFVVTRVTQERAPTETEEGPGEDLHLRPLSPGYEEPLGRLLARWNPEESGAGSLLELRDALGHVRRVRHDINNPLTAALAEVQLLLMDAEEGEARESLEVIQEQLRRIRDRVQELAELRPPTP